MGSDQGSQSAAPVASVPPPAPAPPPAAPQPVAQAPGAQQPVAQQSAMQQSTPQQGAAPQVTACTPVAPPKAPRSELTLKEVGNADDIKHLLSQLGELKPPVSPSATPSKRAPLDNDAPDNAYTELLAATTKLHTVMSSSHPPSANNSFESAPPGDGNFHVHEESVKLRLQEIARENRR